MQVTVLSQLDSLGGSTSLAADSKLCMLLTSVTFIHHLAAIFCRGLRCLGASSLLFFILHLFLSHNKNMNTTEH